MKAIISASVNADIPATRGAWFMSRLDEGFCLLPRREGLQFRRVPLTPDTVAGFVFWTRSIATFTKQLEEIRRRGFVFLLQFGITGYRSPFDPSPILVQEAIEQARQAALRFGPRVLVWRYDPVIMSVDTPADWHVANFERIASGLCGASDEVVVAFEGTTWTSRRAMQATTDSTMRRHLLSAFVPIAKRNGLRLSVCADPQVLIPGAVPARCVDARRLADIAGREIAVPTAGFRPGCLCARATDVGDRAGPAQPLFCGAHRRAAMRPRAGEADPMLYPPVQRFPCPAGEDLPF